MPGPLGGEDKGLSPGGHARAGLSTCLAIGYAQRAALRGIRLHKVEVDIECDWDINTLFGVARVPAAGYSEVRYSVRIESDAPESEIRAIVDEADACSPVLDTFRREQNVVRSMTVVKLETV